MRTSLVSFFIIFMVNRIQNTKESGWPSYHFLFYRIVRDTWDSYLPSAQSQVMRLKITEDFYIASVSYLLLSPNLMPSSTPGLFLCQLNHLETSIQTELWYQNLLAASQCSSSNRKLWILPLSIQMRLCIGPVDLAMTCLNFTSGVIIAFLWSWCLMQIMYLKFYSWHWFSSC